MQVTEASLWNNQSELPFLEVTLTNGLIPTVFQSELQAYVQIDNSFLKR
jgi:hypothetical protein